MSYYNPDLEINAKAWLNLKESERYRVVENFHTRQSIKSSKSHTYLHVYIENMLTQGNGRFVKTLKRLRQEGLTRHQALHAISSLVEDYYRELRNANSISEQEAAQRHLNLNMVKINAEARAKDNV